MCQFRGWLGQPGPTQMAKIEWFFERNLGCERFREWVALEVELDEPTRKDSTGFWRGIQGASGSENASIQGLTCTTLADKICKEHRGFLKAIQGAKESEMRRFRGPPGQPGHAKIKQVFRVECRGVKGPENSSIGRLGQSGTRRFKWFFGGIWRKFRGLKIRKMHRFAISVLTASEKKPSRFAR